jgi:hypothetical protein
MPGNDFPPAAPNLRSSIGNPQMEGLAGAALAGVAVAQIDPLGLARGDDPQRAVLARGDPMHDAVPDLHCLAFADDDLPVCFTYRRA